jgi:hypothetical protein
VFDVIDKSTAGRTGAQNETDMKSMADIAAQAADAILARVEQTEPRALHRDMLIDEITRALEECRARSRRAGAVEDELRARLDAVAAIRLDAMARPHAWGACDGQMMGLPSDPR